MPRVRLPTAYVGRNHETVGSDLLAVLHCLSEPQLVLGGELQGRLQKAEPHGWYPVSWILDIYEAIEERVGRSGLRQMGRQVFRDTHAAGFRTRAKSARDVVYGLDGLYHAANRGTDIGGWIVTDFRPGVARLEKTTPHHCAMVEGILAEALSTIQIPALVQQRECVCSGADLCVFEVTAPVYGPEWSGVGLPGK